MKDIEVKSFKGGTNKTSKFLLSLLDEITYLTFLCLLRIQTAKYTYPQKSCLIEISIKITTNSL